MATLWKCACTVFTFANTVEVFMFRNTVEVHGHTVEVCKYSFHVRKHRGGVHVHDRQHFTQPIVAVVCCWGPGCASSRLRFSLGTRGASINSTKTTVFTAISVFSKLSAASETRDPTR